MKNLTLKSISQIDTDQYQVVYVDERGEETVIVCELVEHDGIHGMSQVSKTDIFMRGYADPMATCRALYAFRDGKGFP